MSLSDTLAQPIIEVQEFGAYAIDSVDHAFGRSSNYAAQLQQAADPALNSVSSSSPEAAQGVLNDVTASENQTLAEQSAQAKAAVNAAASTTAAVLAWVVGLALIFGAIVLMGELQPMVALLGRGKK